MRMYLANRDRSIVDCRLEVVECRLHKTCSDIHTCHRIHHMKRLLRLVQTRLPYDRDC